MKAKIKIWRLTASVLAAGCLFQTGTCALTDETTSELFGELIVRQITNLITDTVFFMLDNVLVRLTA